MRGSMPLKKALWLSEIKKAIKEHHVTRPQMDYTVHVARSSRNKEQRDKAALLVDLAIRDGVKLSKPELRKIKSCVISRQRSI